MEILNILKLFPDIILQDISDREIEEADKTLPWEKKKEEKKKEYAGPSVLSYTLDGRKKIHLANPAYRCYGGGQVTVIIFVNRNGNVVNAQINETVSANDKCLREYALRAARQSKFEKSITAPERQAGEIVYQFIAQ